MEVSEHEAHGAGYQSERNEGGRVQAGGGEAGVYKGAIHMRDQIL